MNIDDAMRKLRDKKRRYVHCVCDTEADVENIQRWSAVVNNAPTAFGKTLEQALEKLLRFVR